MGRIIALANLKGGVGKSTLAVNLACEMAAGGRHIVVIDADAQATASECIARGSLRVGGRSVPLEGERLIGTWVKIWVERVFSTGADIIMLDLPAFTSVAEAALGVADLVLIPCGGSPADLAATAKMLALVERAREARGGAPPVLLVPSRIDRRTTAGREVEVALSEFGERLGPAICQRTAFADALGRGDWIGEYAPDSVAYAEIRALAATVQRTLKEDQSLRP